jgi:hypothetical protein
LNGQHFLRRNASQGFAIIVRVDRVHEDTSGSVSAICVGDGIVPDKPRDRLPVQSPGNRRKRFGIECFAGQIVVHSFAQLDLTEAGHEDVCRRNYEGQKEMPIIISDMISEFIFNGITLPSISTR